jgi:VIT1/CCC1 family predicted Fe2+/Mn2+ transporter
MNSETRAYLLTLQKNEITEHHIYRRLAKRIKSEHNAVVLSRIADEELRHCRIWEEHTGTKVSADRFKVWLYTIISLVFGFTFGVKLMERCEEGAQTNYQLLAEEFPEAAQIAQEEKEHEEQLLEMLDEERLRYTGSIVLGMNDALVELTGVLAGLTLALQNTDLIALTGLITGISASLSMASSEYLSMKADAAEDSHPLKGAFYTGCAYIGTVVVLVLPFFMFSHYALCMGVTLVMALLVIAGFNYYISVAQGLPFGQRFREMAMLSMGVAGISFLIGYLVRAFMGVEI